MAVIIEPDEGMAAKIGRQLLDMADDPFDVRWVSWPQAGFLVPEELAAKLKGARSQPDTEQPAQAPRRRGRPRRQAETPVQDTDNNEKEE